MDEKDINRCLRRLYSKYKAQAKHRGLSFGLDRKEFYQLVTSDCGYCGSGPSNTLKYQGLKFKYNGLDRINNEVGYQLGNVIPSCSFCNSLRGPMKWKTWAGFLDAVVRTRSDLPFLVSESDPNRPQKSFYRF